ncbi:MAG: hypothetical protein ACREBA_01025 [Nitrosotalea sp.]
MGYTAVEVTTDVTEILPFSKNRTSFSIFNNGTITCYISQDQDKILSNGYPLDAGASVTIKGSPGTSPQEPIYGQCSSISTDLRVNEQYLGEDFIVTSAPPSVSGSSNEFQQLEADSKSGGLITIEGSLGAVGVIISYTPSNGKRFTEWKSSIQSNDPTQQNEADLRNATSIREHGVTYSGNLHVQFLFKGDSLLGDGTKTYDVNTTVWGGGLLYSSMEGIIE